MLGLTAFAALWPVGASASPASPPARARGPSVTLQVSNLYSVSVVPGAWVPVTVSVTNRGGSDLRGVILLTSPVSEVVQPGSQVCYTGVGGGSVCTVTGPFSYGGFFSYGLPAGYASGVSSSVVTYRAPLDLAPGTTKQLVIDVLAASAQSSAEAEVLGTTGRILAKASDVLPVGAGTAAPAVLVVTNDPEVLSTLSLPLPDGAQPQVQLLSPADLPGSSAALGAFSAVLIDQADTSALSAAQVRALEGYVQAGGALVVAGGLGWRAAVAGLPPSLLPAGVAGTSSTTLPQLARLLGAAPPPGRTEVAELDVAGGSHVMLSEGRTPLAVEARRGSGCVVLSAVDPAAAPIATWAGGPSLASRLLAPAYSEPANGGPGAALPGGVVSYLGTVAGQPASRSALMGPAQAGSALGAYLEQMPGASFPSPAFLGLLLLGYVAVAGPVCFVVLARLHRRELAWVALPCLAAVAGLVAYVSGAGFDRHPISDEVRVAQLAPGSSLAQVSALSAVYLPRGGTSQVTLADIGPVTDLGAGAGGHLTVGPGPEPGTSVLTIGGPVNSLGGWAASEDASVDGSVGATARQSAGRLSGEVTDHLTTGLYDLYVIDGPVQAHVGTLRRGQSAPFSMPVPSEQSAAGGTAQVSSPFLSTTALAGSAAERQQFVTEGLFALASEYSGADAAPVLFGLARSQFLPTDKVGEASAPAIVDAIVVPLGPAAPGGSRISRLAAQLVGSRGVTGTPSVLSKGGSFDYQFLLPGGHWGKMTLDLGSPTGSAAQAGTPAVPGVGVPSAPGLTVRASSAGPGGLALSAFNFQTGAWEPVDVSLSSGDLMAGIAHPDAYLGTGSVLDVRLTARVPGLEVFGAGPTLSAARATGRP